MGQHNFYTEIRDSNCPDTNKMIHAPGLGGHLSEYGSAVPADTTAGYVKGALFINTTNGVVYVNEGTSSSCAFRPLQTAAGVATTAYDAWTDVVAYGQAWASGWTVDDDGLKADSGSDPLLLIPLDLPPGAIISAVSLKARGATSVLSGSAVLQKRVDGTGTTKTWTTIATATVTGTGVQVATQTFTEEAIVAGTSYRIALSAGTSGSNGDVWLYAAAVRRTRG